MSDITAYSVILSDINFSLISTDSIGNTQNESARINYQFQLTDGSGIGQATYAAAASGTLASGSKTNFDFQQFPKTYFGLTSPVNFSYVKGIIVENQGDNIGENISIHATGVRAFTGIFNNNNSGNYLIKPSGTWMFMDVMSGVEVTSGHNYLTLKNESTTGIDWRMIVVGNTGLISGTWSYS